MYFERLLVSIFQNAVLAAGAISITSKREEVIDFSLGVLRTGVNILVKKPTETLTIFQVMSSHNRLEICFCCFGDIYKSL